MKTITTNMAAWRIAPLPEPIGFTGDNMVTRLEIQTDLEAGWQLKLDIQKFGQANVIDLTRDGTTFYVDLTADMLSFTGTATAQIRGLNGEKVAHSNQFDFNVRQSINAIDTFPPLEPTEMAQLEARVTAVKDLAETAKTAAEQSATNAKASETAAKGSETAAAASEATATQRASAAKLSEDAAKTSELAAKTHADNAEQSAVQAGLSDAAAKDSELSAGASANAAGVSSTQAAGSAAQANQSATGAKQSETAAALSETNAKESETAAKLSETNAKLSEGNAKTSETNAKASETAAKTSETNAGQSAENATLSETNAKTSETNAGTHANNASASAVIAQGAATEATTQAGNATTEADRAKTEADRAEGALVNNNLKLATIDKELSDYTKLMSQVNVNQEARQTVTDYDKILSLPKNAANGSASFGLKGLTAQNLVKNGDFSQGTEGWKPVEAISAMDNILCVTGTGTLSYSMAWQVTTTPVTPNGKIYEKLKVRVTNSSCSAIRIAIDGSTSGTNADYNINNPVVDAWYDVSNVVTQATDFAGMIVIKLLHMYPDAATANGKVMEVKEVMAIDLTALFGAGNEPDVATCDKMFANWFDGMQSVESRGRVKSVSADLTQSTSIYLNSTEPLRRVPNGVCDEIRQRSDGGYELIQRVSGIDVIDGGRIVGSGGSERHELSTALTIDVELQDGVPTNTTPINDNAIICIKNVKFTPQGAWGISNAIRWNTPNQYFGFPMVDNPSRSRIVLSLSHADTGWTYVPSLQMVKDYFTANPMTLIYQLATPIVTPIETSGTLLSYPSGSIYWEPITADAGVYNNGISILATDFPISALEKLSKVDFQTGIETTLDISTAVIASDGLSFTHPDLVNGDIVLFSYRFKDDAPEGNKTIDYYDSRYVVKDSVTGKFYQWGVSVANATPSFDLVEV